MVRRVTRNQEILGSTPDTGKLFSIVPAVLVSIGKTIGLLTPSMSVS